MSRAKEQVILFHSVEISDLSHLCLRRKLIDFFQRKDINSIAGISLEELDKLDYVTDKSCIKAPDPFDSWFEVHVAIEIMQKGYRVTPQYEIIGRRIDLVIEGGKSRLAVECDGDKWHGPDKYDEDMERQRQLERCGWEFFRVKSSSFYFNKKSALDKLWEMLNEREIFPFTSHSLEIKNDEKIIAPFNKIETNCNINCTAEKSVNIEKIIDKIIVHSRKSLQDIGINEISNCIIEVLRKCPNASCKIDVLATLVLKELGIITRGIKRKEFENKVMKHMKSLEKKGYLKQYKAKNNRVKLTA